VSTIANRVLCIVVFGARSELLRGTRLFISGLDLPHEVAGRSTDDRKIEVEEGVTVDTAIGPVYCRRHLDQRRGDSRARCLGVEQVSNQRRPLTFIEPGDPVDDLGVKTERFFCHAAMMPEVRRRVAVRQKGREVPGLLAARPGSKGAEAESKRAAFSEPVWA
jgi:hypothetical protein